MKIASVQITESKTIFDHPGRVIATMEDGEEREVYFDKFADEISFTPGEFVGLTIEEAHAHIYKRIADAWLQS